MNWYVEARLRGVAANGGTITHFPAHDCREVVSELDRLRSALEAIVEYQPDKRDERDPYCQIAIHAKSTARDALKT